MGGPVGDAVGGAVGGEPQRARPPTAMQKLQILSQLLLQYDPSATMEVAEVGGLIMGGELGSGLESAGETAGELAGEPAGESAGESAAQLGSKGGFEVNSVCVHGRILSGLGVVNAQTDVQALFAVCKAATS